MRLTNFKDENYNSRLNVYLAFKELEEKIECENNNYNIINFEEIAEKFFLETKMNLRIFDKGNFFKYLKMKINYDDRTTIVFGLEIIENILYNQGEKAIIEFFELLFRQIYIQKIFFIFTDIKTMQLKYLIKSNINRFPKENIIWGRLNEN